MSCSERERLAEGGFEEPGALLAHLVRFAGAMVGARDDVELDLGFLAGGEQGVAEVVAALHVDIDVRLADGEEESAAQVGGVAGAGVLVVPRTEGIAEPLFVPPELVDPVVVASAVKPTAVTPKKVTK